jgi:uncharacterized membrane protein HdeD (DUF308 family)
MANSVTGRVHSAATWSIVLSVVMIGAGVLAIALPQVAGVAITAVVGWLLVFSGMAHLAFAWRSGTTGAALWEILLGVAYGAIGFYVIVNPAAGLASLTLALAIYLFIEAVLEVVLWSRLRATTGAGWLLFDGVVTLVLAAMIWSTWPSSVAWVLGTLVGISMLFSGISRLMLSLTLRRLTA